jgi:Na+/proline symporter
MQGIVILAAYAVFMMAVTVIFTKRERSALRFHVSDRNIGAALSALSIAATWIWAPALFTASEKAYTSGIPGLFWFAAPNILCLIIFIPFAKRIRRKFPEGITLSKYMERTYASRKVGGVYIFQLGALAVCSVGVQLFAGGKLLSVVTGIPVLPMTVALSTVAYSYSQFSGIKASVITDAVQMVLILGVMALVTPWLMSATGGVATAVAGLGGISGGYASLFGKTGAEVFFGFGLPTTVGLLSGPFGDQSFWQRAFAVREDWIGRAFFAGALLFGLVPISMGMIGYTAAGAGFTAVDTGMVNFEFIGALLPAWVIVPFLLMVISGLLSTVDSNLCSAASLTTDFATHGKTSDEKNIKVSKFVMIALLAAGIAIANLPGISVTFLFLFYGTLRASTLLPTVMTLLGKKLTGSGVYAGVLASLCVGLPIFGYGNVMGNAVFKTAGSLTTLLTSGLVACALSRKRVTA